MPASVGMRGSSQPVTCFCWTSCKQFALAQHRVGQIEPGELDLLRMMNGQSIEKPVVERPVIFELQRADRMGDPFDGIRLAVGEIVGRINTPLIAGAMMRRAQHPVHDRIAQIDIRRCHVDLGAQRAAAVREIRPRACAETDRDFLRRSGRDRGCSYPVRSACRDIRASARRSDRKQTPCPALIS